MDSATIYHLSRHFFDAGVGVPLLSYFTIIIPNGEHQQRLKLDVILVTILDKIKATRSSGLIH